MILCFKIIYNHGEVFEGDFHQGAGIERWGYCFGFVLGMLPPIDSAES